MNKLELIDELKKECRISKKEAAAVIDLFFESMSDALAKGDRVEIRGLCSFYVKEYDSYAGRNPKKYDSYAGRNPKTGESVHVAPKKLPFFKCGKELKERVDY
jgi:integration host factor subunit beta